MPLDVLFDDLEDDALAAVHAVSEVLDVEPGVTIIAEFDTTDSMYVLESGRVNVQAGGAVVATLEKGAILGEIGLFTLAVRTASVITASQSTFLKIGRDAFDKLREAGNPVAFRIERRALGQLTARLRAQVASLQAVGAVTPRLRIPVNPDPSTGTEAPMSMATLTAVLGTTPAFAVDYRRAQRRIVRDGSLRLYLRGDVISDIEGDPRAPMVLLHGNVHAVTRVPDHPLHDGFVQVATLDEGTVFNILPAVDHGDQDLLFVVHGDASVIRLDGEVTAELLAADNLSGSVLRQAMIRSLFGQLSQATTALKQGHLTAVREATHPQQTERPKSLLNVDAATEGDYWDAWVEAP